MGENETSGECLLHIDVHILQAYFPKHSSELFAQSEH